MRKCKKYICLGGVKLNLILIKYIKSPLSRGISLLDRLSENVQRSRTRFKVWKTIQDLLYGSSVVLNIIMSLCIIDRFT